MPESGDNGMAGSRPWHDAPHPEGKLEKSRTIDRCGNGGTMASSIGCVMSALRHNTILYTPDDVTRFHELRRRGAIPQLHPWVLFVLGRYADPEERRASDLLRNLRPHENSSPWSACAFGQTEAATVLTAAGLGGHVRVGFENNHWLRAGRLAQSNADLVVQIRREAALVDRTLADIEATRVFLATTAA
jgi:uncharacterized protein (DUF849 family)